MSKDVMIRIKGVYTVENDQTTAELFTKGKMYKKNNYTYLTYEETETTGYEGCTTTLKIEDQGRVTMIRRGSTSSHLVLQPGIRNIGRYTVYGSPMEIGVFAENLEWKLTDDSASLHMAYTLDMNSVLMSENELFIDVSQVEEPHCNS